MTGRSDHWSDLGPRWHAYHARNTSNQGAAHAGVFSQTQASSFKAPMRIIDVVHAPSQPLLGVTLRRLPPALPADIWAVIISHLDYKDLRQIRLCSRWMAQEGARHLFRCLNIHFDEADLIRMLCVANTQTLAKMTPSNFQRAYVAMDEGLLNLVNLEAIELDVKCDDHGARWRGCMIDTSWDENTDTSWDNVLPRRTKKLYHGAAETAFILRALGWRNSFTNTLSSLTISLPGEAARHSWRPPHLNELWDQACGGGGGGGQHGVGSSTTPPPNSLLPLQKDLMTDAFHHLKSLEINIGFCGLMSPPNAQSTDVLSSFLRAAAARRLERISITLRWDEDFDHLQYHIYKCESWAAPRSAFTTTSSPRATTTTAAHDDVLASLLTTTTSWPALKDIMLVGIKTTSATLLSLLATLAPQLESLHLEFCMLVGSDNSDSDVVVDTWPRVYERMRALHFPRLKDVLFHECVDFDPQRRRLGPQLDPALEDELLPPTYPAFPPAVLQYSILGGVRAGDRPYDDDDRRPVAGSFVKVWPESLYDYILRRTDRMPPCYVRWVRRAPTVEEYRQRVFSNDEG
ncbi:uncharacterized protein LTHEOB_8660 [Lasiodiplodia theobromae]|nr:uncharacterized protein LTHEOB_8660 [Lasiodiplodia theobromae]KAF4541264.1 hypothetical protein LTHEOB_8660 [Lasiodiplodia theobromae]